MSDTRLPADGGASVGFAVELSQRFTDVRAFYSSADQVGKCTVFNIAGNKYRLITVIHFNTGRVYVRRILTHAEYDRGAWKDDD